MKPRTLINFVVTPEKKKEYQEACAALGVSVSELCRKALDAGVVLAQTLEPSTPKTASDKIDVGVGDEAITEKKD